MFYDNIRFVDYLSQGDIQEVAESIIWEFMDYGNTFNGAFGIMMESLSDDNVDCFLTEATVTYGHDTRNPSRGVTTGAGRRSYGPIRGRDTQGQIDSASRAARRQERVSRVVGAARKAAKDVESATKGAVRSAKSTVGGAVSGTVNKAKAALKGLLRSGAKTALRAGRNIERSGQRAERTTAVYGPGYGRGGSTEPLSTTTSGGAKRRAIGGALKSLGKMIKGKPVRPQREATPTRSGASDLARIRGALDTLRAKREDPWNQPFTPRPKAPESRGSSSTQQKLLPPAKQQKSLPPGRSAPPIPPLPTGKPRYRVVGTRPAKVDWHQSTSQASGGSTPAAPSPTKPKALPPVGGSSAPKPKVVSAGQRRAQQRQMLSQKREQEQATRGATIRRGRAQLAQTRAAAGSNPRGSVSGGRYLHPVGASSVTDSGAIRPESVRRSAIERAADGEANATRALRMYTAIRNRARIQEEEFDQIVNFIIEDLVNNKYANSYESAAVILENFSEDTFVDLFEQYIK
jgi:hypothetical protein